ncbi:MFS transporter [Pseudomonas helleri]|uniref:MFS transporter n=1 Tax=Pseudomonas helleri TaxID=1608996 RepID=UPI00242BE400|nr:MFS transporter [Pseudomonas helleri]
MTLSPLPTRMTRQLTWIIVATLCTLVVKEVWQTLIPLIAVSIMHLDPRTLGFLVATETLPLVLLGLLIGGWVDRLGPLKTLGLSQVGLVVIFSISIYMSQRYDISSAIQPFFLVVFLVGLHSMLFDVSLLSVTPTLVASEQLPWANKIQAICQSLAEIVGPILAGSTLAGAGPTGTSTLLCLLSASALVTCTAAIRSGPGFKAHVMPAKPVTTLGPKFSGFRSLVQSALMRAVVFNSLTWNIFYGMLLPIFVGGVAILGNRPELTISVAFSANGAGFLLGSLGSTWMVSRLGVGRTILAAKLIAALTSLGLMLFLYTSRFETLTALAAVVFFIFGAVVSSSQVSSVSIRQAAIPRPFLGRTMAAFRVTTWVGLPIGSVFGGYAAHHFGTFGALGVAIAFNVLCTAVLWRSPLSAPVLDIQQVNHDFPSSPPDPEKR